MDTLPLEGLFLHLVRHGFPLSVRDYQDALGALQCGYGMHRRDRLHWLCETLWARNDEEKTLLARLFREFPQPTPEAIDMLTATHRKPSAKPPTPPATAQNAGGIAASAANAGQAPFLQFSGPLDGSGVGLPKAAVPESLLQPHIFTPRPAIGLRALIVIWRRFRLAQRSGPKVELDIDATVSEQSRSGTLIAPVLVPARRNQARLVVLFDASPSMAPWRHMGRTVAASLERSQLGHAAMYYFNNDPGEALFPSDQLTRPTAMGAVTELHPGCCVLVIGDAGAARGHLDHERVRSARSFAAEATRRHWSPIAWVNPMPRKRWTGTSAQRIAAITGMRVFELTEEDMVHAIDYLRGKAGR